MKHRTAPTRVALVVALALVALAALAGVAQAKPKKPTPKGDVVTVMTRNLYLGADLTPAIQSTSIGGFIEANGGILRAVDASNFPVRSKGLAKEILEQEPDLVGLQEAALWRTAPPSLLAVKSGVPVATEVKYDFLAELLKQLNKKGRTYRAVVVNPEFDFEAPANYDGLPGGGPGPGLLENAEVNGRLTMRDVILARVGAGVKTSNPKMGHYANLLVEKVAGASEVTVTRGWTSIDASVRGGPKFHFVNTHLEAFDPASVVPSIRALQASELVGPGGAADPSNKLPVILVGDLNSDVKTEQQPGDGQAYRVVTGAGYRERATSKPNGCCISGTVDLKGGSVKDFNHKVDHILTDDPKGVKLVSSAVTGRQKNNGYWDSDHAGLASTLEFR